MAEMAKASRRASKKGSEGQPDDTRHNLTGDEQEAEWLRQIANCRAARAVTDKVKEQLKAVKKAENLVRNATKLAGFPLKIVDEILEDEGKTTSDRRTYEELRRFMRSKVGLASGAQLELFATLTPEARTEAEWGEVGYNSGLRGVSLMYPPEMPPEFQKTFSTRWSAGNDRMAWAMAEKGLNPEAGRSDVRLGSQVPDPDEEEEPAPAPAEPETEPA